MNAVPSEIICTNTTPTGSIASDSGADSMTPCECQCRAENVKLKNELRDLMRWLAAGRGQIQKCEARLTELVLKD